MNVACNRKLLQQFRNECKKKFPVEHLAALFGQCFADGSLMISDITPIAHEADENQVNFENSDLRKSKMLALREKKDWIGTIHSHCFMKDDPCCWHLSSTDINVALEIGELICGLIYVFDEGKRTQAYWYVPSPIPKVKYY